MYYVYDVCVVYYVYDVCVVYYVYDVCVDAMSSLEKGEDGTSSLKLLGCLRVVCLWQGS